MLIKIIHPTFSCTIYPSRVTGWGGGGGGWSQSQLTLTEARLTLDRSPVCHWADVQRQTTIHTYE